MHGWWIGGLFTLAEKAGQITRRNGLSLREHRQPMHQMQDACRSLEGPYLGQSHLGAVFQRDVAGYGLWGCVRLVPTAAQTNTSGSAYLLTKIFGEIDGYTSSIVHTEQCRKCRKVPEDSPLHFIHGIIGLIGPDGPLVAGKSITTVPVEVGIHGGLLQ